MTNVIWAAAWLDIPTTSGFILYASSINSSGVKNNLVILVSKPKSEKDYERLKETMKRLEKNLKFEYKQHNEIIKAINSGWVSTGGSNIKKFENKIKKYTNSKYCLAVNSGTTAFVSLLKIVPFAVSIHGLWSSKIIFQSFAAE